MALLPWLVLGVMALGAPYAVQAATRIGYLPAPGEETQQEEVTYP